MPDEENKNGLQMKPWKKIIIIVFIAALAGIQLIHPARNSSLQTDGKEISTAFFVPSNAQQIIRQSCYDCHSNNTRYPWYAQIQPVDWWLHHHITEGKRELNFDEFASYSPRKQYRKFKAIGHEVQKGDMPLESYLLIHRNAKLSDDQRTILLAWCEAMRDSMKTHFPIDSLERPNQR
jgi:hypothetical protein